VYTTDRICSKFKDVVSNAAQVLRPPSGKTAEGTHDPTKLCVNTCATANNALCNDGGEQTTVPGSAQGPATCAWGTDCADCGPRDHDDCLPFYSTDTAYTQTTSGSVKYRGQYWNVNTVRCTLPDAVLKAEAGQAYASVANDRLTWDFMSEAAAKHERALSAEDNFFNAEKVSPPTADKRDQYSLLVTVAYTEAAATIVSRSTGAECPPGAECPTATCAAVTAAAQGVLATDAAQLTPIN
jgi:hypothetical protein